MDTPDDHSQHVERLQHLGKEAGAVLGINSAVLAVSQLSVGYDVAMKVLQLLLLLATLIYTVFRTCRAFQEWRHYRDHAARRRVKPTHMVPDE